MEPDFWRERWATNQIGFHENDFHPMLRRCWDSLAVDQATTVFVPLCGKSRDMVWLRNRGHEVVGIELSEIAVQAFFDENEIRAEQDRHGPLTRYRGAGYTLLSGNFFDLTPDLINPVTAVYDRAALIALPPEMRQDYARHLQSLCASQALGLLITVSYPVDDISPPPFLVAPAEVASLYDPWCTVTLLGTGETAVKGAPGTESAYRLQVR